MARRSTWSWVAWGGIVLLYVWVRLPLIEVPLDRDEGAFALIGRGLLRGELPYVDHFDHKPPGVFLIYAAALLVVAPSAAGIHLFLALWNFGTLVAVASLAGALFGRGAALWAGWLYALVSAAPTLQGFTASTEMLLLLPLVLSLRLLLAGLDRAGRGRLAWLAGSGALGALACWIKQPAAVPLLVAPVLMAWRQRPRTRTAVLRDAAAWLAGGLAASAIVIAPFALAGALGELGYWAFVHNVGYGGQAWPTLWQRIPDRALGLLRDLAVPAALAVAGAAWAWRRRVPGWWLGPLFLALSLLTALQSPFLYRHYFALACPALALAAGCGAAALVGACGGAARAAGAAVLAASLAVPMLAHPWFWWRRVAPDEILARVVGSQGFELAPRIAAFLRERMAPEDWMFIYGSEPQIPFLADRRNANPFVMIYPLTAGQPRELEFQERTWARIEAVAPKYLLVVNNRTSTLKRPTSDRFFERKIDAWAAGAPVEAMVVAEPGRRPRFVEGVPARPLPWLVQILRVPPP